MCFDILFYTFYHQPTVQYTLHLRNNTYPDSLHNEPQKFLPDELNTSMATDMWTGWIGLGHVGQRYSTRPNQTSPGCFL